MPCLFGWMVGLSEEVALLEVVVVDEVSSSVSLRPRTSSDSREEAGVGSAGDDAASDEDEVCASGFFFVPPGIAVVVCDGGVV